ncbi:MAG: glycosyltransferase [Patescibacteria group bacterium]|nr:glycosyltransferase [Patescibacteria group bacterium]
MDTNPNKPLVSVIMAAYNAEKYIGEAIESMQAQTYTNWELIIADDAAKDATGRIADDYAKRDPRIKVIHLSKNSGQAIARNEAVKIAKGEYLAVLDADDLCLPDRFAKQVAFLDSHPNVAAVGSYAKVIDASGQNIGTKRKPENYERIRFKLLLQTQFIHSTVMMRTKAFKTIGMYDNSFLYVEDYDLWSRFSERGFRLANIPESLVKYRIQPTSVSAMSTTQKIQMMNVFPIYERNIRPYITLPPHRIQRLVDFFNGRRQSAHYKIVAFIDFRKLVNAYIRTYSDAASRREACNIYRDIRKSVVISLLTFGILQTGF